MGDRRQSERQGRGAEALAILYLLLTGYRILVHRWRGSSGEIDIVAQRWQVIVFCEVKFRHNADESGVSRRGRGAGSAARPRNSQRADAFRTALHGGSTLSRFRHLFVAA